MNVREVEALVQSGVSGQPSRRREKTVTLAFEKELSDVLA